MKIVLYCNSELFNNDSTSTVSKRNFKSKSTLSWSQLVSFRSINSSIKCNNMIFLNVFSNEAINVVDYSMYSLFQFQLWLCRSSYNFQLFKYIRCIDSYDITYINIENQKNSNEMRINEKIVDETHELKMIQIAYNSLAKNINFFFCWWKINLHDSNISNAFLMFSNYSWRYVDRNTFFIIFEIVSCEAVYERVINVITSAHGMRSENYYVKLHFLETLNRKVLWKESWEWKLYNVKVR